MQVQTLSSRNAVVTGASRGIGRAITLALAANGVRVHAIARSEASLAQLAKENPLVVPHACDITNSHDITGLVQALSDTQVVPDILVNNAGVFHLKPIDETTPQLFRETLEANLIGPFGVIHALLPIMRHAGQGDVVTIGSVADRQIFAGNAAYSASKFGARALHEVMRAELSGTGIRCTLISPAATDTTIWNRLEEANTSGVPARTSMLRPEDVADAVLWVVQRPPHVNIEELRLSHS